MKERNLSLARLFWLFMKVGVFTIGGGYAMLPVAERMLAGDYSSDEVLEAYTVAQTVPGVIAANMSVVLGYKRKKFLGALSAVLGVIFPSVLIISIIAMFISKIEDIEAVNKAFAGIRIGVLALLCKTAFQLGSRRMKSLWQAAVFALSLVALIFDVIPAIYVILISAVLGFVTSFFVKGESGGGQDA